MEKNWIAGSESDLSHVRLVILLNHTSLYEPLFLQGFPLQFLWKVSRKIVAPGADKTLDRPIVGFFWKLMAPGIISITRKRDKSWFKFLELIHSDHMVMIAPEGRMKRQNGLDSSGRPMSVRSGVAEIISELSDGKILIGYSGGLHHVQHPGENFPRLFKTIKMNLEILDIDQYKASFKSEGIPFRRNIVRDLEVRLQKNIP